jgi:hypothetical protein
MGVIDILLANLLSPIILAFVLGIVASLIKSDLKLPPDLYTALSIYLLFAIGLKGGAQLQKTALADVIGPALLTFGLGVLTPLTAFAVLRGLGGLDRINASALAAHYGSVSAVTFIAAGAFGTLTGAEAEGYMPALVAILEVPAIVVGLLLALAGGAAAADASAAGWQEAMREVVTGKSVVLLVGGLLVGAVASPSSFQKVEPFFVGGFQGALTLFLLELGLVTARRLRDLKEVGLFLLGFGLVMPILHGALAIWGGTLVGMSVGGAAVLGAMVSSASYIAAPAAVRIALPRANPTFYLTASLGITFPFNLTLGIPLYFTLAEWLA